MLLVWTLASVAGYVWQARPSIGGVDFFYYACFARDMVEHPGEVSADAYGYFPGVYTFWRSAIRLTGGSLASLQNCFALLLIANAVAVAVVVVRATGQRVAAVFAGVWFLVLCSRYQGFTGVTEPIATLPFLIGVAIWNGQRLDERKGIWATLVLGVALGLTLYCKQQAGLLWFGLASFVLVKQVAIPGQKSIWSRCLLLVAVALATTFVGVFLEGRGWQPLWQGLSVAGQYGSEGSVWRNLYTQIRADETAWVIGCLVIVFLGGTCFRRHVVGCRRERWWRVALFCALSSVFSLVQFYARPFGHYTLLGVPGLVISATLIVVYLARELAGRERGIVRSRLFVLIAACIPLGYGVTLPHSLQVWRVVLPKDFVVQQLWHKQADVAQDIELLRNIVQSGASLYVLPPRHNSIHFLLETRSVAPLGYRFRVPVLQDVSWQDFESVVVLREALDDTDERVWPSERRWEAEAVLREAGFRKREISLRTMDLFQK